MLQTIKSILLDELESLDLILITSILLLLTLACIQHYLSLKRSSPFVPLKQLPLRPALQILFKPDDDLPVDDGAYAATEEGDGISAFSEDTSYLDSNLRDGVSNIRSRRDAPSASTATNTFKRRHRSNHAHQGLPDSFAPLLSSSEMQLLTHDLTAALIHALYFNGTVQLGEGRHVVPLDKDEGRPQFYLDTCVGNNNSNGGSNNDASGGGATGASEKGCQLSISTGIGSQNLSQSQDLDTTLPTKSRSRPIVKHAQLTFDPPVKLGNVSPTLLHFPTLFEDLSFLPLVRGSIFGFILDGMASILVVLEKVLWWIEKRCVIHLGKVQVTPVYISRASDLESKWRLSLSFSGYVLLFNCLPIPFINVRLPTFIIPQPHALLDKLLSKEPLASARVRREEIREEKIAVAVLGSLSGWSGSLRVVGTPPALGVDLTVPGGITVAVEMMHGRETTNQYFKNKQSAAGGPSVNNIPREISNETLSTWQTPYPAASNDLRSRGSGGRTSPHPHLDSVRSRGGAVAGSSASQIPSKLFDANSLVPWYFEASVNGTLGKDKLVVNIPVCKATHTDNNSIIPSKSILSLTGSVVVCRAQSAASVSDRRPAPSRPVHKRSLSNSHLAAINAQADVPPIHALMLFPETYVPTSKRTTNHLLEYDYEFDVGEESHLDAISLSYGASHPMLKGGTLISCMLESIYAYGTIFAREGAIADPSEKLRKRNILRHLPAVDFTAGIENFYLPKQSVSYFDDGNTRSIPEIDGGRVMFRVVGGIDEKMIGEASPVREMEPSEGIKLVADFGVSTFASTAETNVKEFPELDIFEGTNLCSFVLGTFDGSVMCHLRPQVVTKGKGASSTTGPNVFNPLEAYEIDFSGSSVSLKLKESSFNLGHRRVIVPTETTFAVKVLRSIVNMSFEGTTQCELSWDFQGSPPLLQVTSPGQTPAQSTHENREQAPLLIHDLCQGRLNLDVSSVGGISFTRASTSREDKQGLYDWKFFNALVSPDQDSPTRIRDVLYDKKTMHQLLAVIKLLNSDMEKILRYVLTQIWRAKSIFDEEGISDPGHALPSYRLARLASLFLCGDVSEVDNILPIIRRVVAADGLDVVGVKELVRKHVEAYDEWAAEIDRGVKWLAAALAPMPTAQPFVETDAPPLCETIPESVYHGVPTAKMLYDMLQDKPNLPLDLKFSKLVGRVAPYLTFRQVSYVLQSRPSNHWQSFDLKRLRYVYTIKKKVQEVAESYGGLSFMPQSFFLSVFLGEATRSSLRAPVEETNYANDHEQYDIQLNESMIDKRTVLAKLRRRRMEESVRAIDDDYDNFIMSPASRIASASNFSTLQKLSPMPNETCALDELLGDSLLGPQDVAVLLQAGLTSALKGSTVVQLNQRMLLDLMASQPRSFAIAVLAELGIGGSRALTSALMSFVEMDQSSFKPAHRIDMHHLLESWLHGIKIPKREDYLAGGRWARQSYYDAMFGVSVSILDLAETYIGLKLRLQRVRHHSEKDPLPLPKQLTIHSNHAESKDEPTSKLLTTVKAARDKIAKADELGKKAFEALQRSGKSSKDCSLCVDATAAYKSAFEACRKVRSMDKLAFQADWFKEFYTRNYNALMVLSIYDNVMNDIDRVRIWMEALRCGSKGIPITSPDNMNVSDDFDTAMSRVLSPVTISPPTSPGAKLALKPFFTAPEKQREQDLVDAIIDAIFYDPTERESIKSDPLVRMLISNDPGQYNFTMITAMGVITEGKKGMELQKAIERLEKQRGVVTIRSDTGTARSFDYNASKIEEAVESAIQLNRPFGIVGYSQGCANEIHFESMMLSGTPDQQKVITSPTCGMVCRQLLFSAANGSIHGPAGEEKIHKLITMSEDFFKYQQGYFSRAFISSTLEIVNDLLDSSGFQKFMGGMQGFFPEYLRAFWREAQHLPHIPTCVLRGVLEPHTTPESLDMLSNQLSKQSGSILHDSQVHVYDAVGHPIYVKNRNMRILKQTDMGGAIQRTHHWSPLSDEVEYVKTNRDVLQASFDCAKDRHIFPFVDVNARFGIIQYAGVKNERAPKEVPLFSLPTLSTPLPVNRKTIIPEAGQSNAASQEGKGN